MSSWALRAVASVLSGVTVSVTISIGPGRFTLSGSTDGKVTASAAVAHAGGARAQGVSTCLPVFKECDSTGRVKSFDKLIAAEGPARLTVTRDSTGHAEAAVGLSVGITDKKHAVGVAVGFQKTVSQAKVGIAGLHGPTFHPNTLAALARGAYQPTPARVEAPSALRVQGQNNDEMQRLLADLRKQRIAATSNLLVSSHHLSSTTTAATSVQGVRIANVVNNLRPYDFSPGQNPAR